MLTSDLTFLLPNIISDLLQLRLTFSPSSSRLLLISPQGGVTYKRVQQVSGYFCAARFSELAPRSGAAPLVLGSSRQTRSFPVWCPLRERAPPTETTLGWACYNSENGLASYRLTVPYTAYDLKIENSHCRSLKNCLFSC